MNIKKAFTNPSNFGIELHLLFFGENPGTASCLGTLKDLKSNGLKMQNSTLQKIFLRDIFLPMVTKPQLYGNLTIPTKLLYICRIENSLRKLVNFQMR